LEILALAIPLALYAWALRRKASGWERGRRLLVLATCGLGAALFVPVWLVEGWIQRWAALDEHARGAAELPALLYAFFVAAPMEQGLKVAGVVPAWRSRYLESPADGVLFASACALGFMAAHNAELFYEGAGALEIARALMAVPGHLFF